MGFVVITVREQQVVEIGDDIEIIVKKGQGAKQFRLVIKAPKEIYIRRTQKSELTETGEENEIPIVIKPIIKA